MINLEINLNDTNLTLPQIVDASKSANLNGDMETPQHRNALKKQNHKTNLMSSSLIKKKIF